MPKRQDPKKESDQNPPPLESEALPTRFHAEVQLLTRSPNDREDLSLYFGTHEHMISVLKATAQLPASTLEDSDLKNHIYFSTSIERCPAERLPENGHRWKTDEEAFQEACDYAVSGAERVSILKALGLPLDVEEHYVLADIVLSYQDDLGLTPLGNFLHEHGVKNRELIERFTVKELQRAYEHRFDVAPYVVALKEEVLDRVPKRLGDEHDIDEGFDVAIEVEGGLLVGDLKAVLPVSR